MGAISDFAQRLTDMLLHKRTLFTKKQIASLGAGCYNRVLTSELASKIKVDRFTDSNEGFVHVAYKQYLNRAEFGNFKISVIAENMHDSTKKRMA